MCFDTDWHKRLCIQKGDQSTTFRLLTAISWVTGSLYIKSADSLSVDVIRPTFFVSLYAIMKFSSCESVLANLGKADNQYSWDTRLNIIGFWSKMRFIEESEKIDHSRTHIHTCVYMHYQHILNIFRISTKCVKR